MNRRIFARLFPFAIVAVPLTFGAPPALAIDPANLQAGPVFISPTLDTELGYDDNLLRSRDDEEDTGYSIITPRVQTWLENGLNTYSFTAALVDYRYFDSSDDDITDEQYNIDLHHVFNARNTVDLYAEYWDLHETRGTGVSEGFGERLSGPIKLDRTTFGVDYFYGSESSQGRLELALRTVDQEYKNFPQLTRFRDREQDHYGGTFLWRVAPRTDALFELRYIDTQYDRTSSEFRGGSLDSEELHYLAGASWEATAKTTGSVRAGMIDRDYDSDDRDDEQVFSWEVDVTYLLRSYSRFNLASSRQFNETNGLGSGVDTRQYTLSWSHDWNGQSSTRLETSYGDEDYTESNRQDDRYQAEAVYEYAFRRWMDASAGYRYEELESDLQEFDFTRNLVYLKLNLSL